MADETTSTELTQEVVNAADNLPRKIVIKHDGQIWVYCWDMLCIDQVLCAQAVFNLQFERADNPPKSVRDLKMSGSMTSLVTALGYLILREVNGVAQQWNPKSDAPAEFLSQLPATFYKTLLEVKEDFFDKADILDSELIGRFKPLFKMLSAEQLKAAQPTTGGPSTLQSNSELPSSTLAESAATE